MARLESLTADDPTQQAAVAELRAHVTAKMAELAETIRLRASSPDSAHALMMLGSGQRDMAAIR